MMHKAIWLSLLVLLLSACNTPAPENTATPEVTPSQANRGPVVDLSAELNALKAGDTAAAIAGLEKILANYPTSAEAHLLLGQALFRAGQKEQAEERFRAAFSLNPQAAPPLESQDADEWLKIGNAHASLNQLDDALAAYQKVLALQPDKAAAYTNIGVVYYQTRRFDDAVQQMQKALDIDPDDAETHYMLGATYMQQQKLDEAEESFNRAVELKPDLAAAYTGLGNVQLARKNVAEAVTMLQRATSLQPDQPEAWLALGQAYAVQGNQAEAGKALSQCVQISQNDPLRVELYARCQQVLQQLGAP